MINLKCSADASSGMIGNELCMNEKARRRMNGKITQVIEENQLRTWRVEVGLKSGRVIARRQ